MFIPDAERESKLGTINGLKQLFGKKLTNLENIEELSETIAQESVENYAPVTDISHQREVHRLQGVIEKLKEDLKASEDRFQNAIAKNADGIIIVNKHGVVCFVNVAAESLFNCKKNELVGKDFFGSLIVEGTACDLELNTEIQPQISEVNALGRRVVQTEVAAIRKGKENAIVEMRVVETEWEGEIAYLASLRDITERKQAEEALQQSEARSREQATQLEATLNELKQTHSQLIQSEKMSSLGLLVAGVAHEINNPVSFINGNLNHLNDYTQELLHLLRLYQQECPQPSAEIQKQMEVIEIDFLIEDLTKILSSMNVGVERICQIVQSLRNFSRHDEAELKSVNLHEGIDSTLLILNHRLKVKAGTSAIEVIKEYGNLPLVECYPGPINQVFMNVLSNALDAIEDRNKQQHIQHNPSQIRIRTEVCDRDFVEIRIADNGLGMTAEVQQRIFDAFFTTKPVGKGTGMGLSISYQIIVERHKGEFKCVSEVGKGTEFIIKIPIQQ